MPAHWRVAPIAVLAELAGAHAVGANSNPNISSA